LQWDLVLDGSMKRLVWKNLVGQERTKEVIGAAFDNGALGHAYLFCGDEGSGTVQAAVELAAGLLCESDGDAPCYRCPACTRLLHYAHPDFHMVFPVYLAKEHRGSDNSLSQRGWDYLCETAGRRVRDPYLPLDHSGVPTIPVEWIREVNHAVQRGPLSADTNVAVVCGADVMQKESANAMLKTLEEPPSHTLIILCTERPHLLLPTIVSRCQVVRFGYVSTSDILSALAGRFRDTVAAEALERAAEGAQGSLGRALLAVESPLDEIAGHVRTLWGLARQGDWLTASAEIGELARVRDFGFYEKLFTFYISGVRTAFLGGLPDTQNYISTSFEPPAGVDLDVHRAQRLLDACEQALRGVRARGNIALILVNFLMGTMEILREQEHETR
jgi:DNA polymerase-3 subunit delta'